MHLVDSQQGAEELYLKEESCDMAPGHVTRKGLGAWGAGPKKAVLGLGLLKFP